MDLNYAYLLTSIMTFLFYTQEAIILEGYKFIRIDGTTKVSERERIVKVHISLCSD